MTAEIPTADDVSIGVDVTDAAQPSPEHIVGLGVGFWGSKVLLSAVELGVFTELAREPLPLEVLADRVGLHPRSSRDFLDALVSLGMLRRTNEIYSNTPDTDVFLDKAKPSYIGAMFDFLNTRIYGFWGSLTTALRTGRPQSEIKEGGEFFEVFYQDPARSGLYLRAMSALSTGSGMALAAAFPWHKYATFVDIGCAEGAVAVQVARAHQHLSGGGFDLPPAAAPFADYVTSAGLRDRLRFHTGDFFADPLPTADVLIMGHVLHDWNLEEKLALIQKAYAALPEGGALIIYDNMIDDDRRENTFGLLISLNMLIENEGGFDYTGADCRNWLASVGFTTSPAEPLAGPTSMIVAVKPTT